MTWLRYVPYTSRIVDWARPRLIWPALIGKYHVRPLPHLIGNAPTIGQTLYITVFFIVFVILTGVNYKSKQPHAWFANQHDEILAYVFYRTGTFAFVLLPLTLLFSSRNNILLWLTNWSHSTYILLHRWIARLFTLYALLHTLLALPLYYPANATEIWWIWGAVAMVATSILAVASGLWIRRFAYEIFLITHILLSVFVIAGCWYHVKDWVGLTWGYETWLYAASAVWFFDRLLRVSRTAKTGFRRAVVTELDGGKYVRVDIPGIRWAAEPGKHVYIHFPTLTPLRPWECHPFSIVPTAALHHVPDWASPSPSLAEGSASGILPEDSKDAKGHGIMAQARAGPDSHPTVGLTLLVKKSKGVTRYLQRHNHLLTLLDGPYPNTPTQQVLQCDRVILIGGGIGITSLLPWLLTHWNTKLCWSVKEEARCLVEEVQGATNRATDKIISIGSRLDFEAILSAEAAAGWARVGVVISGPAEFCDDARAAVVTAGRQKGVVFELEVDAYTW